MGLVVNNACVNNACQPRYLYCNMKCAPCLSFSSNNISSEIILQSANTTTILNNGPEYFKEKLCFNEFYYFSSEFVNINSVYAFRSYILCNDFTPMTEQ